jgi:flagellar hook assembly protein FlgD
VTATNTPVMTNLELKVYNEAGEVVKTFSNVLVLGGFSGIQLSSGSGSTIFDPNSGLFDIEIKSAGIIYHVPWDGKSDLGYLVDSGQYVLKADIPGLQGNTVVMPLTVLKSGDLLTVSIYTTSGELVKQLYQSYFVQGQLGSMKLTSNLLQISNQPTGTTTIGINIFSSTGQLMADGLGSLNQARLTWDGTTALGNYVQSGEYLIKIDQTYNHQHDVLVQSVTVLSSNLSGFMDASVYPNPYLSTPDHKVWFKVALQDQSNLTVRIYDVVGELVNTLSLPAAGPGIATLGWDVNNAAAGLYVGIVEAASQVSGQTQKKALKISIIK